MLSVENDGGNRRNLKVTTEKANLVVGCPICGRRGKWLAAEYRPFCSERCKLIDIGQWFEEGYRVSVPLRPDHFADFENLPADVDPDQPSD